MKHKISLIVASLAATTFAFAQAAGPQGGPPRQGGPGQGGPGFQRGPGGGMMRGPGNILLMPDVQQELKLSEVQKQEIFKLLQPQGSPGFGGPGQGQGQGQGQRGQGQRGQGQGQGGFGGPPQGGPPQGGPPQGGPGMGRGGMDPQQREQMEQRIREILSEAQYKRYRELTLQQMGPQALSDKKVADEVGLSEEQVQRIRDIMRNSRPQGGPGQGGFGGGGQGQRGQGGQGGFGGGGQGQQGQGGFGGGQGQRGQFDPQQMEQMRQQMQAQREKVARDILAVLTSAQRAKWDAMLGKKFDFKPMPQFGRGPGGGGN